MLSSQEHSWQQIRAGFSQTCGTAGPSSPISSAGGEGDETGPGLGSFVVSIECEGTPGAREVTASHGGPACMR